MFAAKVLELIVFGAKALLVTAVAYRSYQQVRGLTGTRVPWQVRRFVVIYYWTYAGAVFTFTASGLLGIALLVVMSHLILRGATFLTEVPVVSGFARSVTRIIEKYREKQQHAERYFETVRMRSISAWLKEDLFDLHSDSERHRWEKSLETVFYGEAVNLMLGAVKIAAVVAIIEAILLRWSDLFAVETALRVGTGVLGTVVLHGVVACFLSLSLLPIALAVMVELRLWFEKQYPQHAHWI